MKRGNLKGFILGFLLCAVLFGLAVPVLAAGGYTTLSDVFIGGIRIVIDGKELHPTDVNGNTVEPMIYNGTTYLPVRAVSTALGKAVYWDGPERTVYLGNMDGKLEYPTATLEDLTNIGSGLTQYDGKITDNYGNRYGTYYTNSLVWGDNGVKVYEYLTNMKFTHFKGTIYVPEGTTANKSTYLQVEADGRILYTSPEITKNSYPIPFDVNITGYNDIVIRMPGDFLICLGDAGFYQ